MTSTRILTIRILRTFPLILATATLLATLAATTSAQNPVPFIDQPLVPDAAAPGGPAFTLTVNGAGFVPASVVNWNGSPRATTFVSSSQLSSPRATTFVSSSRLTAAILATDTATASTATITVVNPSPGGGVSNAQFFSITVPASSVSFVGAVTYSSGSGDSEAGTSSIAVADVNGDGIPDLLVAGCSNDSLGCGYTSGEVGVLLGNGDGTFQPVVTYNAGGAGTDSVAVADLNGDGKLDLVVTNDCGLFCSGSVGVLLGNGDGTFQPVVIYGSGGTGTGSGVVADVNQDGKLDILVVNSDYAFYPGEGTVGVLLGNGDGTFQPVATYGIGGFGLTTPLVLAAADLTGDGKLDLVVTNACGNCSGSVGVLLGNGDGTFQTAVTYGSGGQTDTSVAIADVNGDGKPDLLVANSDCPPLNFGPCGQSTIGVLLGSGKGTFQPAVSYGSSDGADSVVAADVNGDGKPDLVAANVCVLDAAGYCVGRFGGAASVLLGKTGGTFQPALTYGSGGYNLSSFASTAVAVADLNGDGKPDLAVTNSCGSNNDCIGYGSVGVLLNNTGAGPTTTRVTSSLNPSTYGQRVTLTASVRSTLGTPTGTVVFYDASSINTVGSAALISGSASISVSSLGGGAHSITATYQGSLAFASSTSAPLNQVVKPAATTTALTSSLNPSLAGQAVTFTATMTSIGGNPPNGELVTFYYGENALGPAFVTDGIASLTASSLGPGTHAISAVFPGDANFSASTSPALEQVVDTSSQSATTTALTSSLNPSTYGQNVTWTATVTTSGTAPPTGKVNFNWSDNSIGTAALNSSGVATLTRSALDADTYPLIAVYAGDANNGPSVSAMLNQVVREDHERLNAHLITQPVNRRPSRNLHCHDHVPDSRSDRPGNLHGREDSHRNSSARQRQSHIHNFHAGRRHHHSHRNLLRRLKHLRQLGISKTNRRFGGESDRGRRETSYSVENYALHECRRVLLIHNAHHRRIAEPGRKSSRLYGIRKCGRLLQQSAARKLL